MGAMFIVVTLFLPKGIVGTLKDLFEKWGRSRQHSRQQQPFPLPDLWATPNSKNRNKEVMAMPYNETSPRKKTHGLRLSAWRSWRSALTDSKPFAD